MLLVIVLLAISVASGATAIGLMRPGAARQDVVTENLGWREIAWPFPRDGWPAGRAFRCRSASCVEDSEIYLRAKLGFCNCETGVADDDEVDRVADLDLISPRFAPREPGRVVRLAELNGRARSYDLQSGAATADTAVGFALSHRCDLMVAVINGKAAEPLLQQAAQQFLDAHDVRRWMIAALEGK